MDEKKTAEEAELREIEKSIERELRIEQLKEKHGLAKQEAHATKLSKVRAKLKEIKDGKQGH